MMDYKRVESREIVVVLSEKSPLSRGSIAHLITDRVPEILGDGQLVGCVPDGRRGDLNRAVVIVADPRPLNGDLAENRLESVGTCPPPLDASAAFAVPVL